MSNLNLNKAILAGRLTSDLELKQVSSGASVVTGSIAVTRKKKDPENKPITDFFNFVAWRGTAEIISKFFKKGSAICLIGELQTRTFTDGGGVKRYITELKVDEVKFIDNKPSEDAREGYSLDDISQGLVDFECVEDDGDMPF